MPQRPGRILRATAPPLPLGVFFTPLEAVRWDHNRQLKISDWLLQSASAERLEPFEDSADELLSFLCQDLVLHH